MAKYRIGIDLGGTKIEIAALDAASAVVLRQRVPTPAGYEATLVAITGLVRQAERELGATTTVGIGIPGVISPATGMVKNANSLALNGHVFDQDMSAALDREVRVENDANCFALSESTDGATVGFHCVFGVILGTGCGGGIVVDGRVLAGRHRVAGEWGHTPLPWPEPDEFPGRACWCGRNGCLETYLSGPGLAIDGPGCPASELPALAANNAGANNALDRHVDRLGRGLAVIIDILDPDAIVLGGGLSNMLHLYDRLPPLLDRYVFTDVCNTPVLRNHHGDSSGVRGAAWLWPAG
jgi:fructokinase